jgi:polyhydroxyalkanoate synthesis regulator protein
MDPSLSSPLLIKRYGNRRLYAPAMLSYVSPDQLSEMVLRGRRFIVRDAASGDDVTGEILERLE